MLDSKWQYACMTMYKALGKLKTGNRGKLGNLHCIVSHPPLESVVPQKAAFQDLLYMSEVSTENGEAKCCE